MDGKGEGREGEGREGGGTEMGRGREGGGEESPPLHARPLVHISGYAPAPGYMSPGYKLYPFVSPVAVYMYLVSATKLSLTRHNSGVLHPLVSGYKLLVRDTCIRLHVSWV